MKIAAFAGSTRKESFNKKLVKIAAEGARKAGADVTVIDLRDYPMPLYDGDMEASSGLPEKAKELSALLAAQDGLIISCPEYNHSMSGVLKNTIDWLSREKGTPSLNGKTVALMAASIGGISGARGLPDARKILSALGVIVLPAQFQLGLAGQAFDEADNLKDAKQQEGAGKHGAMLVEFLRKKA